MLVASSIRKCSKHSQLQPTPPENTIHFEAHTTPCPSDSQQHLKGQPLLASVGARRVRIIRRPRFVLVGDGPVVVDNHGTCAAPGARDLFDIGVEAICKFVSTR
jgi:hypothetical protein